MMKIDFIFEIVQRLKMYLNDILKTASFQYLFFINSRVYLLILAALVTATGSMAAPNKFPDIPNNFEYNCDLAQNRGKNYGTEEPRFKGVRIFYQKTNRKDYFRFTVIDRHGCAIIAIGKTITTEEARSLGPSFYGDPIEENFPTAIMTYLEAANLLAIKKCQKAENNGATPDTKDDRQIRCEVRFMSRTLRKGGVVIIDTDGLVPFSRIVILIHKSSIIGYGVIGFPDESTENFGYDTMLGGIEIGD